MFTLDRTKNDTSAILDIVRIVAAQRQALLEMRSKDQIGDDAFHQVEAQLDVAEVNAMGAEYP